MSSPEKLHLKITIIIIIIIIWVKLFSARGVDNGGHFYMMILNIKW